MLTKSGNYEFAVV